MTCLDDRRLLDVHGGEGSPADREHLLRCRACASRMAALAHDLGRVDAIVRTTVPRRRRAAPTTAWRWMPAAAVAALLVALTLHRVGTSPVAFVDDDTLALADDVAALVVVDDAGESDGAASAPSTCVWGEPLLGVGCETPDAMQTAWR